MGFKQENYTLMGRAAGAICVLLFSHLFSYSQINSCEIEVPVEPSQVARSQAAGNSTTSSFPFFVDWQNTDSLKISNDQRAIVSLDGLKRSELLIAQNLGFNLPPNAKIDGVELVVEGRYQGDGIPTESWVSLVDENGQASGENKAGTAIPSDVYWSQAKDSDFTFSFGSPTDHWGLNLTDELINNPSFGYAIQLRNKTSDPIDIEIDHISIKVYYTPLYQSCNEKCIAFYAPRDENPAVSYEWRFPNGFEMVTFSENYKNIILAVSYAEYGTYDICLDILENDIVVEQCCRAFNHADCTPAVIGDLVWQDLNGDAIKNDDESGVPGIPLTLFTAGGSPVATAITDNNGFYQFQEVATGTYYVEVEVPSDLTFTWPNIGGDEALDSDITGEFGVGTTGLIEVFSGDTLLNIDIGLAEKICLGDQVFFDENADGQQGDSIVGIEDVSVTITNAFGALVTSTVTNETGIYSVCDLPIGTYELLFDTPEGFFVSPQNVGDDESDSDIDSTGLAIVTILTGGANGNIDAGFYQNGSISGFAWFDTNQDGLYSQDEPLFAGVEMRLRDIPVTTGSITTTDENGFYSFDNVLPGAYSILATFGDSLLATVPLQGNDPTIDSDFENTNLGAFVTDLELVSGQNITNINLGLIEPQGKIGGTIWKDENGDGIFNNNETPWEMIIAELQRVELDTSFVAFAFTDLEGNYVFENLPAGDYFVRFYPFSGFFATTPNQGPANSDSDITNANGENTTDVFPLAIGEELLTIGAGYLENPKVGDFVWLDANGNGQQDADEVGLAGVTVDLFSAAADTLVATAMTNENGLYEFANVGIGDYYVQVELIDTLVPTLPFVGDVLSDSNIDTDGRSDVFSLVGNERNFGIDAGFQQFASVGDFVWLDANGNGLQDPAETGLAGVGVSLFSINGFVSSTTTDGDGKYLFSGLLPGEYAIEFAAIDSLQPTNAFAGDPLLDSNIDGDGATDLFTLASGEANTSIDAGYSFISSRVSGFVWVEIEEDGQRESQEVAFDGMEVVLVNNTTLEERRVNTNSNGEYVFQDVEPGTYYLLFEKSNRYSFTQPNQGDDATDSDVTESVIANSTDVFNVVAGTDVDNLAAGLIDGVTEISGSTWLDSNSDGRNDQDEQPIEGIQVILFSEAGVALDTTITDGTGSYQFAGILEGNHFVTFEQQEGFFFTIPNVGSEQEDSDVDELLAAGSTALFGVTWFTPVGNIDAGFVQGATIGDFVFEDMDRNGINNSEDIGVDGVLVNLLNNNLDVIASDTTAGGGFYEFTNVVPGNYIVAFTKPPFSEFVNSNQDMNEEQDSDAEVFIGNTGATAFFTVLSNQVKKDVDAGIYFIPPSESAISGFVWQDRPELSGIFTAGEDATLTNQTVELYDATNDQLINSTVTDLNGGYLFAGLTEGSYYVKLVATPATEATLANQGTDESLDSDITGENGPLTTETIELGEFELKENIDLGVVGKVTIGDFVWNDTNANGIQEAGEPGLADVEVTLAFAGGSQTAQTTTDENGFYLFDNIDFIAGDYQLFFDVEESFSPTAINQGTDITVDSDVSQEMEINLVINEPLTTLDADAGFVLAGAIEGMAFTDFNGNGQRDDIEPGINNLQVSLFTSAGMLVLTTTTQSVLGVGGQYSFPTVPAGDYYITFEIPDIYLITDPDVGDDASDSDITNSFEVGSTEIFSVVGGATTENIDGGLFLPGGIAGQYWFDTNTNGILEIGEEGIEGLTVNLYRSFGLLVQTTITDENGHYAFDSLKQGLYFVEFIIPEGFAASPADVGGNDDNDSDGDASGVTPLISLAHGAILENIDMGIFETNLPPLRSFVWFDENEDGLRNEEDSGIAEVEVLLLNESFQEIDRTVSNHRGQYSFQEIEPGEYYIAIDMDTAVYDFTLVNQDPTDLLDNDIYDNGLSDPFTATDILSVPNIDVGLVYSSGIVEDDEDNETERNHSSAYLENIDIEIAPMPFVRLVKVTGKKIKEDVDIFIFARDGRLIKKLQSVDISTTKVLNFKNEMPGLYYMKVVTEQGIINKTIIKQN